MENDAVEMARVTANLAIQQLQQLRDRVQREIEALAQQFAAEKQRLMDLIGDFAAEKALLIDHMEKQIQSLEKERQDLEKRAHQLLPTLDEICTSANEQAASALRRLGLMRARICELQAKFSDDCGPLFVWPSVLRLPDDQFAVLCRTVDELKERLLERAEARDKRRGLSRLLPVRLPVEMAEQIRRLTSLVVEMQVGADLAAVEEQLSGIRQEMVELARREAEIALELSSVTNASLPPPESPAHEEALSRRLQQLEALKRDLEACQENLRHLRELEKERVAEEEYWEREREELLDEWNDLDALSRLMGIGSTRA